MQNVISPGDFVVSIKNLPGISFESGDIIAFKEGTNPTTFIKRIVAKAGDTLRLKRQYIEIGKKSIPHDPIFEMMVEESEHSDFSNYYSPKKYSEYLLRKFEKPSQYTTEDGESIIIPKDHFFLVGDNYFESMDSRFWGFIPIENIKGKVVLIF